MTDNPSQPTTDNKLRMVRLGEVYELQGWEPPRGPSPLDYEIARLRRLYLHALHGGTVTANDLSRTIVRLEKIANA